MTCINPPKYVFIGTLSKTLTLRAAFASSTYLLLQIPGPGRSSDDDLLIPLIPFSRGHIRPSCTPERMATASLFFGPASDDALLYDLFGAEEEQDKAQEHKQQVEHLRTEIFLVKDDGAENEGNEDAAAPYH